ncbi:beta-ketoacyl synthase N-terminal-like domain-containing protein [Capnocytophaga sp.]|uniref:beta-ketoacyl synthase chain length factor n=1 Tax=Capnocytophaga sp. TaxID=44737 RepID=UPI0026DB7F4E|nr:beta-ketoacyl synthase N-terminal-like domain-containing protein [Capnocytophaga sp.]MDO5105324.1 beta-ketoacyl synthase chain length factor [Capnocytophaga sp.]
MNKTYINGLSAISTQPTFSGDFLTQITDHEQHNVLCANEPAYKEYIPPAAIRRMAKGVKMSIVAGLNALKEAEIQTPEAIIVGTGMGCLQDSEKFLRALLDNDEQHLTPTAFIQSTHNTVAGQIALNLQCKGLNFTYVNGAISFESALLDAKMQLEQGLMENILVGGVDEHSPHTLFLYELAQIIKRKEDCPDSVLNPQTGGVVLSEGATFFALSNKKNENSYAELIDTTFCNNLNASEVSDFTHNFLNNNNLTTNDIDLVISGRNGNKNDTIHFDAFEKTVTNTPVLAYKHLSGEFYTASAFGMWTACNILKTNKIPVSLKFVNQHNCSKPVKNILLYNQYLGKDHSLTLLKKA